MVTERIGESNIDKKIAVIFLPSRHFPQGRLRRRFDYNSDMSISKPNEFDIKLLMSFESIDLSLSSSNDCCRNCYCSQRASHDEEMEQEVF